MIFYRQVTLKFSNEEMRKQMLFPLDQDPLLEYDLLYMMDQMKEDELMLIQYHLIVHHYTSKEKWFHS